MVWGRSLRPTAQFSCGTPAAICTHSTQTQEELGHRSPYKRCLEDHTRNCLILQLLILKVNKSTADISKPPRALRRRLKHSLFACIPFELVFAERQQQLCYCSQQKAAGQSYRLVFLPKVRESCFC